MEHITADSESIARAKLIEELKKPGKIFKLGNNSIRFVLQKLITDPKKVFESGRILAVNQQGETVSHVDFAISYQDSEISITHKGYGETGESEEEVRAAELEEEYGGLGIIGTATSLVAEYGIYNSLRSMIGYIGHTNSSSLNSRQKMKPIIGTQPFEHERGDKTAGSVLIRTNLIRKIEKL